MVRKKRSQIVFRTLVIVDRGKLRNQGAPVD